MLFASESFSRQFSSELSEVCKFGASLALGMTHAMTQLFFSRRDNLYLPFLPISVTSLRGFASAAKAGSIGWNCYLV